MTNKRIRMLRYGITCLMVVMVALLYPGLPEQIPTNWGAHGDITYGSKKTIWIITGILVLLAFLYDLLPYIDPRKRNYQKFGKIYDFFGVGIAIFLSVMIAIILYESYYPGRIETVKAIYLMTSLLFLVIGNYLPKVQSNFYMGIKNPWTLSSDEVWRRTHRFAGKLYVGCGIITLLATILLPGDAAGKILLALVLGSTGIVTLLSYIWWKRIGNENEK